MLFTNIIDVNLHVLDGAVMAILDEGGGSTATLDAWGNGMGLAEVMG